MPTRTIKKTSTVARKKNISKKPQKYNWKLALLAALIFAIPGYYIIRLSYAAGPSGDESYEKVKTATGQENAIDSLRKVKSNANHQCAGVFEVQGHKDAYGKSICTSTNEITAQSRVDDTKIATAQDVVKKLPQKSSANTIKDIKSTGKPSLDPTITSLSQAITSASGSIGSQVTSPMLGTSPSCYGNGIDGHRLVLVASGTAASPIKQSDLDLIQAIASQMESILIWNSYNQNPNSVMHWRFAQDANCKPIIITATQSADYYLEPSVLTFASLHQDAGLLAATSAFKQTAASSGIIPHFVVFTRSGSNACGQSDFATGGGLENTDSYSYIYGKIKSTGSGTVCWDAKSAQHETLHAIGAVDFTSPHTTFFGHCTDMHDIMCYADGGPNNAMSDPCPIPAGDTSGLADYVMDCNADDYFSVKPNADSVFNPPFYLFGTAGLTRYNTAKSAFMTNLTPTPIVPTNPPSPTTPTTSNIPPIVSIQNPKQNDILLSNTVIAMIVNATSANGIAKVEFFNGTTKLGESTKPPYKFNLMQLPGNTATLTAVATDQIGLKTTSSPINLRISSAVTPLPPVSPPPPINNTPPVGPSQLSLGFSFDWLKFSYAIQITWPAATKNSGATNYHVLRNDKDIATVTGLSYSDYSITPDTSYTYKIYSQDLAGNKSIASSPSVATIRCLWIFCGLQ